MNAKRFFSLLALLIGIALSSISSLSFAEGENSGFLGDYSRLEKTQDSSGEPVMRYVNPKLKPGAYQAVLLEPAQFYPAPMPSKQVSPATLDDIRRYFDKGLRDKLGSRVKLVSEPGPGVLRIKPAITAVAPQTPGLKPYQYIPIAFIVTSAKGRGKEAAINVEFDAVDSVSGERMGASVRKGAGAKLKDEEAQLSLNDVRPLLDRWIDTGASTVADYVK